MAEWLYEDGIGEQRAALLDDHGRILRARIAVDGTGPQPGLIAPARLIERQLARLDGGAEITLDRPPAATPLGAAVETGELALDQPGGGDEAGLRAGAVHGDARAQDAAVVIELSLIHI